LLVPANVGVCVYLKSTGLFSMLRDAGVEVDDRGIGNQLDAQIVLPLSRFSTEADVTSLVEQSTDRLAASSLGAANIIPVVGDVFAELANNAVQHAESAIGAFGFIQFRQTQKGRRFVCVVADGGIGIRAALERNPNLSALVPYDWTAIERALEERVSGTGDATRGIGLYSIAEEMQSAGRQMIIHSGQGMMSVSALNDRAQRTTLFPGTLVSVEIPT
jgi:anti-sigma regulatory factor (Ser/Thr protein kinase)